MSSHGRYDDRRRDSGGGRRDSSSHRRDSRRPSPPRRERSPPPKPRNENELPEQFGRGLEDVPEDDNNVLQKMKSSFETSPLGELYKCVDGSRKIKVWTRNFKEVRGICTGYVLAFDKHWNLVMVDVDEVFLRPRKAKTPYLNKMDADDPPLPTLQPKVPKKKKAPAAENPAEAAVAEKPDKAAVAQKNAEGIEIVDLEPKEEEVDVKPSVEALAVKEKKKRKRKKRSKEPTTGHRNVSQLFVRGDNIVMVSILDKDQDSD